MTIVCPQCGNAHEFAEQIGGKLGGMAAGALLHTFVSGRHPLLKAFVGLVGAGIGAGLGHRLDCSIRNTCHHCGADLMRSVAT